MKMGLSSAKNILRSKMLKTENRNCTTHGDYPSNLVRLPVGDLWEGCPMCEREKIKKEDQETVRALHEERQRHKNEELLGRAQIPKRFRNKTLDNYNAENEGQEKALRSCKRYVDEWENNKRVGTSLVMCGKYGTGKTHLAIGILKEVMERGDSAMLARMIDFARVVKETYGKQSGKTERQVIAELAAPDLLVIDELGRQFGSDTEKMILFDVINARSEDCKPTILITNLPLVGLRKYMDGATEDRLREGGGRVLTFDWESYRGRV